MSQRHNTRNTHATCRDIVGNPLLCKISSFDDGTNPMKNCFSTKYASDYVKHESDSIPNHEDILAKLDNMPECSTNANAVKRFWGNKREGKTFDEFLDFHKTLPWGRNEEVNICLFHKIADGDKIYFNDYKNQFKTAREECSTSIHD